jgi:hypothetical protein
MIGRKTLIEFAHIAAGIGLALVMAWAMAWAVPLAKLDIWAVDLVSIVVILIMGVQPVREAMAADKAAAEGSAPANG